MAFSILERVSFESSEASFCPPPGIQQGWVLLLPLLQLHWSGIEDFLAFHPGCPFQGLSSLFDLRIALLPPQLLTVLSGGGWLIYHRLSWCLALLPPQLIFLLSTWAPQVRISRRASWYILSCGVQ